MTQAELMWLRELRLEPGVDVELVNLSARGALVETRTKLQPGSRTVLQVTGTGGRWTVSGSVSRAYVKKVEAGHPVVYRGALVFDEPIDPAAGAGGSGSPVPAGHRSPPHAAASGSG